MVDIPWLSVLGETWIQILLISLPHLLINLVADRKIAYSIEVKDDSKGHFVEPQNSNLPIHLIIEIV